MKIKRFLESIDYLRVIVVSIGYIIYMGIALYRDVGNQTVNILLISATILYLIIYILVDSDEHHHVKRKTKTTYIWVKRFIHVVNAVFILSSIVLNNRDSTPFTIVFKYVTIVNFIVQVLASLFRFILKNKNEKLLKIKK